MYPSDDNQHLRVSFKQTTERIIDTTSFCLTFALSVYKRRSAVFAKVQDNIG
jgi:hypothetical protein